MNAGVSMFYYKHTGGYKNSPSNAVGSDKLKLSYKSLLKPNNNCKYDGVWMAPRR